MDKILQPKVIEWLNGLKKENNPRSNDMLPTRDSLQS